MLVEELGCVAVGSRIGAGEVDSRVGAREEVPEMDRCERAGADTGCRYCPELRQAMEAR
jgi:hypothetical protein